ncbi:BA14K family protein [Aliirhizobium smilacinae]|uniref:Lectin-like protein BA14k n=1 Tax=Aliirhizobium smilacinae TaxID=1395944 RepID=A0A5C4XQN6_9HYPH|nr:BA14K family protein [Rhizobium smilacinae]
MTAFRMRIATALTAAAVLATSFIPASAMPLTPSAPMAVQTSSVQATEVQYRRDDRDRRYYRERRDNRRGYYNGHRGYREHRRGYRQHNGYWFPLAAFATGAIIGGAINSQPRASGSSHVQWCASRYRTYRASDNTYVASAGVRRSCVSPR